LTESLKIGVLVKKKLKKSLEIEKIGFLREVFHRHSNRKIGGKKMEFRVRA